MNWVMRFFKDGFVDFPIIQQKNSQISSLTAEFDRSVFCMDKAYASADFGRIRHI